jgi:hypothetical protein
MTVIATRAAPRLERRLYDPTLLAPRDARRFVDDLLGRWGWDGARATVALLTSELVTDALRQAPTCIALHVELADDTVRIEVSDDPGLIADASAGRLERQVARRLLEKLARSWGSDLDRRRTTTWFSMHTDDPCHDAISFAHRDPELALRGVQR